MLPFLMLAGGAVSKNPQRDRVKGQSGTWLPCWQAMSGQVIGCSLKESCCQVAFCCSWLHCLGLTSAALVS